MSRKIIILFVVLAGLFVCTGSDCDIDIDGGHGGGWYDYYVPAPVYVEPVYYDPYYYW